MGRLFVSISENLRGREMSPFWKICRTLLGRRDTAAARRRLLNSALALLFTIAVAIDWAMIVHRLRGIG